jgi:ferredoxin
MVARVSADVTACIGSGQCVLAAPDVFDQDDDGTVTVLDHEPPDDFLASVRSAAQRCPVRAITVDSRSDAPERPYRN